MIKENVCGATGRTPENMPSPFPAPEIECAIRAIDDPACHNFLRVRHSGLRTVVFVE
jgi:hypothetical protein